MGHHQHSSSRPGLNKLAMIGGTQLSRMHWSLVRVNAEGPDEKGRYLNVFGRLEQRTQRVPLAGRPLPDAQLMQSPLEDRVGQA